MIAFSDNGAAGDSTDSPQSKKAKVLRLARTDPFLSVDEIARAVGTTSRYVRTSLSEAGLTLTELRRRFARDLRRRMSAADSSDDGVAVRTRLGAAADGTARRVPSSPSETRLRVAQRIDADLAALLGEAPEAPLLEISRVRWSEGQPLYVNQLVTNNYVTVSEDLLASDDPLHNLMGGENGSWEPTVVKRTVDIVPAAEFIAESLRLRVGHPILRSSALIATPKHQPLAVEINYFDALRVRVELETASRLPLRVIERNIPRPAEQ